MTTMYLILITLWAATETSAMRTRNLTVATGSPALIPVPAVNSDTVYEMRKKDGGIILVYHGSPMVRWPYSERVSFYLNNGSISWKDVRKEDSGIYQHWMNLTIVEEILLQVIDPVNEPTLSEKSLQDDDGHCLTILICTAGGDSPYNMTILKNMVEIMQNITTLYNFTTLHLDGWDLDTDAMYSCKVENPVIFKMSPVIKVKHRGTHLQRIAVYCMLCILFAMLISQIITVVTHLQKKKEEQRQQGTAVPVSTKCRIAMMAANLLTLFGFLKELSGMFASFIYGLPTLMCLSGFFFMARICWYLYLGDFWSISYINLIVLQVVMAVSGLFSLLLFLLITCDFNNRLTDSPCNMLNRWELPLMYVMICVILVAEIAFFVMHIRQLNFERKQTRTIRYSDLHVQKGEQEHNVSDLSAGDNEDSEPKQQPSDLNVLVPNENEEAQDQASSDVGPIEGGPEEQQEKVSQQKRYRKAPNQDCGESQDRDNHEGQSLLTVETDGVALDEDRVANG